MTAQNLLLRGIFGLPYGCFITDFTVYPVSTVLGNGFRGRVSSDAESEVFKGFRNYTLKWCKGHVRNSAWRREAFDS